MRPASSTRVALRDAIRRLCPTTDTSVPWPSLVPHAGVNPRSPSERRLVRRTVENMVQAGELERRGSIKPPGSRVHLALYGPASPATEAPGQDLDAVARCWVKPR